MALKAGNAPRVGEDLVVNCQYVVVYPQDSVRTWHPLGRILFSSYDWELIAGDTVWTDTLLTLEPGSHQVILRPTRRDILAVDAWMEAPPEGSWQDALAGRAAIDVIVR